MDKDYKDFDMTGATRGIPPQIARLQEKNKSQTHQNEVLLIDPDVWQLIRKNANKPSVLAEMNGVLRQLLS